MIMPMTKKDKYAETIDALMEYNSMKQILLSYSDDATEVQEHLTSIHTPILSWSSPGSTNPHATDGSIARSLDPIDVVKDRYQHALKYMLWFQPAWDALSDNETFILSEIYMMNAVKAEAVSRISERLHIERAQVYRRKNKALKRLSFLLFGRDRLDDGDQIDPE
jgi:DNA-directed RNA polymerase specialized sigma subunit